MKKENKHWVIKVHSWGTLFAIGTEEQAEEWRRHKARWERSIATKREATESEVVEGKFEKLSDLIS